MARLKWVYGTGPATTQELAAELFMGMVLNAAGPGSLWGIIDGVGGHTKLVGNSLYSTRRLDSDSVSLLYSSGLAPDDINAFRGSARERCQWAIAKLRAIP